MFVESKLNQLALAYVERRLLREYLDLPGLSLSLAQAARLVCADERTCEVVLNDLMSAGCLVRESETYARETRYGDLEGWKDRVRNRLAALTLASPSPAKAARSARAQRVDRRVAEPVGTGLKGT